VVGVAISACTLTALANASLRDPGILPRLLNTDPPAMNEAAKRPAPTGRSNGVDVPLRFCTTCKIYRPTRASHCRYCDTCVDEFDHHCPWVCNCVGKRNYRYFILFIMFVTLLDAYIFCVSVALVIKDSLADGFTTVLRDDIVAVLLCVESFLVGCCVVPLASYHCYLVATGITTREEIRGIVPVPANDACCCAVGSLAAWKSLLFSPMPPSMLRLKQPHSASDPSGLLDASLEANQDAYVVEFLQMQGFARRSRATTSHKPQKLVPPASPSNHSSSNRVSTAASINSSPIVSAPEIRLIEGSGNSSHDTGTSGAITDSSPIGGDVAVDIHS